MLTRKRYYFFVHIVSVNLTSYTKLSINTIDKFRKVCYTRIKLENKTKNLTNNKNKQRKTKMIFETYKGEANYESSDDISEKAQLLIANRGKKTLFVSH